MRRKRHHKHLEKQLLGYRLTTAEIVYCMPDYLDILQSYIWQEYDMAPKFPELRRFLDYWEHNLDGPIHQVRVASKQLIKPVEVQIVDGEFRLN
jgi:uncharacterized protein Usg